MMSNQMPDSDNSSEPVLSWPWLVACLLGIFILTLSITVILPSLAPNLARTLTGDHPKAYWYLSRGSAIIAYIFLWASMVFGLLVTNKMARLWPGGPAAMAMHEYVSLLGLGFAMFHALILMGDQYIQYNLAQILLPFGSFGYKPFWVGFGQLGFYLMAMVTATFYLRKRLGGQTWRLVHYASFVSFLFALVHGLFSGTDTATPWMTGIYWFSGASIVFLIAYRLTVSKMQNGLPARPGQPVSSARKPS
jgi:predicted ferric reductase